MTNQNNIRPGCHDVWNSFMVKGADFSHNDIPHCPTTATSIPKGLIPFNEAKKIFNKHKKAENTNFYIDKFVHFFIDDYLFDGPQSSIWIKYEKAYNILCHFAGVITPDFSTYADFPMPLKIYNTYRMRAFGYWLSSQGIKVINNIRWGTEETFFYTFDGISQNSIVAIGAVASNLRSWDNRSVFIEGFSRMIEILAPSDIIIYGSVNYPEILDCIHDVRLHCFNSDTACRYQEVLNNE